MIEGEITEKKYKNICENIDKSTDKKITKYLNEQINFLPVQEQKKYKYLRKAIFSAWFPATFIFNLLAYQMITIGPAVFGIYRIARAKYDKCTKHCGVFNINTFRRQMCMTKCKLDNLKNEILPNLKRIKSTCNKSKNPEKCNRKADEEIRKIEKRIVKSEIKWRDIQNQAKIRGFENTERHTKIDPSSKKWNLFRKYEK